MSDFKVTILGCGSARPSLRHNPSSQVVQYGRNMFMIDCGEGTQVQMRRYKIPVGRVRHIFISHLHGDHFLGLPGLLSTMSLTDIDGQVHVYCFPEGIELLKHILEVTTHHTPLSVVFHPLSSSARERIYEDENLVVESFPLYHYVASVGFLFREKPRRRPLRGDMLDFYNVPLYRRAAIKEGEDFVQPDGTVVPNSLLSLDPPSPRSYAYCSDTMRDTRVAEAVRGATVLYHEATYADDKTRQARDRGHSTARQAAEIALMAKVPTLVIGHYSQAYRDETLLLEQAREVFPNTLAAREGLTFDISLP